MARMMIVEGLNMFNDYASQTMGDEDERASVASVL